jgi:hypothetical protein
MTYKKIPKELQLDIDIDRDLKIVIDIIICCE